ncbi:PKD domain-containing protein [Patescibacteria group bacterium]|nr:PKD domain-containing protein [Patescibacteria group bacterium]
MKQNKYLLFSLLFVTLPQSVGVGTPSAAITVGVQDPIAQTGCIALTTSSPTGKFSSSATNWNPVTVLTMNKGTSNRSFFYKDSTSGGHTLKATFALKPTSVTDSCASWAQSEWGSVLRATQSITIGTSSQTTQATSTSTQTTASVASTNTASQTLTIKITTQPTVVVGAGSSFTGLATNSHGSVGADTRYIWNFGDGSIQEGSSAFHTYSYPGTYNVMLSAGSGDKAGVGRVVVQVVSAKIGLLTQLDGSVLISNQSSRELNIGLWNISSGLSSFQIPPDTLVSAGQSVRFSPEVMHMVAGADTVLKYPNNFVAPTVSLPAQETSSPGSREFSAKNSPTSGTVVPPYIPDELVSASASAKVADNAPTLWPYVLGALGLILIGAGLFYKKNPMKKVTNRAVDEFDI